MTTPPITSELVEAFSQCKRKAFFLLHGQHNGVPHDLDLIIGQRAELHRDEFLSAVVDHSSDIQWNGNGRSKKRITSDDLSADCDVVVTKQRPSNAHAHLEPYLVVGTHSITSEQKLRLAFAGHVLGNANRYRPKFGFVVPMNNHPRRIQLERIYPQIYRIVNGLRRFRELPSDETPPLFLNEHCSTCPFRSHCLQEAEQHDNLTLLDRVTPKVAQKYRKKGIFTVEQLSYVFKPRRRRKRPEPTTPSFNVELQALAVRTGKIYLHQTLSIPRGDVEFFLDIEGIPDQKFDYLIGLVIKDHEQLFSHSFWADSPAEEHRIFQECREIAAAYADAPIFHYGSYETRAFARATKQYGVASLDDRLVNVNSFIFGKVYFPTRSNSLKDIGRYIGAEWTTPGASGLKSLVWRYRWEETQDPEIKKTLMEYNRNDCHALRMLVQELRTIGNAASDRADVDFADAPKQLATTTGEDIHRVFDGILKSAHFEYQRNRIRIRRRGDAKSTDGKRKRGARKGIRAIELRNISLKGGKIIDIPHRRKCPVHMLDLEPSEDRVERCLIDLLFTGNGCRKTLIRYRKRKAYCPNCQKSYLPNKTRNIRNQVFGRGFQAWAVYQRVSLRLPYDGIAQSIQDLFGETIRVQTLAGFVRQFAESYLHTERGLQQRILRSPFIHIDETKISIRGTDNYVWVITDGARVFMHLTETRETEFVKGMLNGYEGVLVTDFYGGYDGVNCKQQKCLVHLIRDLNDDLWKNPFNQQYETFVGGVGELLVPIFEDVERYGLKARNLRKHVKSVERFRKSFIDGREYSCDVTAKYQKRFLRYTDAMFTFLQADGIPWNNNTAERALRHLAVQRKISGSFSKSGAEDYLRLLGIAQTCRFQEKSFLRFLLSGEEDIDKYKCPKVRAVR